MKYLLGKGYRVIPVNPGLAGQEILGQKVYASLADVPGPSTWSISSANPTRRSRIAREAIALKDKLGLKVLWMQLGVRNDEAAARGRGGGLARRHEPLPQDRIRAAVGRDRLGRRKLGQDFEPAPQARRARRAESCADAPPLVSTHPAERRAPKS